MLLENLYHSPAVSICFDGDGDDPSAGEPNAGDPSSGDLPAGDTPTGKSFTQDEMNKFLAEDRRKHKTRIDQLQATVDKLKGDSKAKEELEQQLEAARNELMTKDEKDKRERKKLEEQATAKITDLEKRANTWEGKYRELEITHALIEAARTGDAFNPIQVMTLLRGQTKLEMNEDGSEKVVVYMEGIDPMTKEKKILLYSPSEAVEKMRDEPELFGNLFKANIVGGLGSNSSVGGATSGKPVNVKTLTPEQYRKLKKENPGALGLRPQS